MQRRRALGSILILTLFFFNAINFMALALAYHVALGSRSVRERILVAQLENQAQSLLSIAIARLAQNRNEYDSLNEPWSDAEPIEGRGWLPEWDAGEKGEETSVFARYRIIDEESKINVMYASDRQLERLGLSRTQTASLLDWMDEDSFSRADGAEEEYYLRTPDPHACKDAPLETLEELLMIRGFSLDDYRGEDANHNRVLDANEDDGPSELPRDNADGILRLGWIALLRCVGDSRINLNTAPPEVLRALPIREEAVRQILTFRGSDGRSPGATKEERVFRAEKDIESLDVLTDQEISVLKAVARYRSQHFRVFTDVVHRPTGLSRHLEVLVRADEDGSTWILQWRTRTQV